MEFVYFVMMVHIEIKHYHGHVWPVRQGLLQFPQEHPQRQIVVAVSMVKCFVLRNAM